MVSETTLIISIVGSIFASGGFWAFITFMIQRKDKKNSTEARILKGLGHDRICWLGEKWVLSIVLRKFCFLYVLPVDAHLPESSRQAGAVYGSTK